MPCRVVPCSVRLVRAVLRTYCDLLAVISVSCSVSWAPLSRPLPPSLPGRRHPPSRATTPLTTPPCPRTSPRTTARVRALLEFCVSPTPVWHEV